MRTPCLSPGRSLWFIILQASIDLGLGGHLPSYRGRNQKVSPTWAPTTHSAPGTPGPAEALNPTACFQIPFWEAVCRGCPLRLDALPPREPQGPVSPPSSFCSNATFPTSPILTLTSHLKSRPLTLGERSQTQKLTSCVIPFIGNIQNRKIHRKQTGGCRSWEEGELGDDYLMGTGLSLG